ERLDRADQKGGFLLAKGEFSPLYEGGNKMANRREESLTDRVNATIAERKPDRATMVMDAYILPMMDDAMGVQTWKYYVPFDVHKDVSSIHLSVEGDANNVSGLDFMINVYGKDVDENHLGSVENELKSSFSRMYLEYDARSHVARPTIAKNVLDTAFAGSVGGALVAGGSIFIGPAFLAWATCAALMTYGSIASSKKTKRMRDASKSLCVNTRMSRGFDEATTAKVFELTDFFFTLDGSWKHINQEMEKKARQLELGEVAEMYKAAQEPKTGMATDVMEKGILSLSRRDASGPWRTS
ncbi:hypothetical protein ACFL3V_03815, partial [Nanoarchaeota archaeon]